MLFVGEDRSKRAKDMNVTWSDGRLAAKQLFEALLYCGIDPKKQDFTNWFEGGKTKTRNYKGQVVAMGNKVSNALSKEGIEHIKIVHPAARGRIRKKELYFQHVEQAIKKVTS